MPTQGKRQMAVGVLGGTFDPVHCGHLHLARSAREARGLDPVLLVPAADPPHKERANLTPAAHRVAMLERALAEEPGLEVCRIEVDRPGPSYTVDTLRALRDAHPDTEYRLLLGADMIPELHKWREVEEVLRLGRPIIATRPSTELTRETLTQVLDPSLHGYAQALAQTLLPIAPRDVSSTEVRARVRRGESIEGLVPPLVAAYIRAYGLYRS